jgi:hypothetical protein
VKKKFIESGKVEDAARKASPQSEQEAQAMQKAESSRSFRDSRSWS